jgi:hypothetical protein
MAKIKSPWTPEQVEQLNKWQQAGWVHPFTCGNEHPLDGDKQENTLIATAMPCGWICPGCLYTQNWCHDYMLDPVSLAISHPKYISKMVLPELEAFTAGVREIVKKSPGEAISGFLGALELLKTRPLREQYEEFYNFIPRLLKEWRDRGLNKAE